MTTRMDRRSWLSGGSAAMLSASVGAFTAPRRVAGCEAAESAAVATVVPESTEHWPLWPHDPPGSVELAPREQIVERPHGAGLRDRIVRGVATPLVSVFRPKSALGGAVLIVPGGGYRHVVIDKEGFDVARWLAASGVVAAVLRYRLPGDGWRSDADVPLQDAQRAIRLLRTRAEELGVCPDRIGVLGFSAGGHAAGIGILVEFLRRG
jgi:acetyl esterase/lipase